MHYCEACEQGAWHLEVWDKDNPSKRKRVEYNCRSWRHEGECRRWKGSQDFTRIASALSAEKEWTYIVLTFSQREWRSPFDQYRAGVVCWSKMRKRMARAFGKVKYIQTWERFRKGGVHVNVMVHNQEVFKEVSDDFRGFRDTFLTSASVACGFGHRCWCEPMRDDSRCMAGYLSKLATELTGQGKDYQIPVDAPPHFRRIRASQKTLPPVIKSDMTGVLWFCPIDSFQLNMIVDEDGLIHELEKEKEQCLEYS